MNKYYIKVYLSNYYYICAHYYAYADNPQELVEDAREAARDHMESYHHIVEDELNEYDESEVYDFDIVPYDSEIHDTLNPEKFV